MKSIFKNLLWAEDRDFPLFDFLSEPMRFAVLGVAWGGGVVWCDKGVAWGKGRDFDSVASDFTNLTWQTLNMQNTMNTT